MSLGSRNKRLKLFLHKQIMGSCADNCSGHGECFNGTCFCEIQFVGDECRSTNTSYFAVFATIFYLVALICFVQLVMSIIAEWQRMKSPSILKACRITTQKLLYFVVFLASAIRGAYFTSPEAFDEGWSHGILSAYYPLLLSGSSLIVCFWAEIFHLTDLRWKQRQFLSKSFLGFVTFNVISYSLLFAELTAVNFLSSEPQLKGYCILIFNTCYAVLLFIVVVFFLIYGVEVFFKVRGGFLIEECLYSGRSDETRRLFRDGHGQLFLSTNSVNTSQLHQSRFGLLSQAVMMIAIILYLSSGIIGEYLQIKFPVHKRNWMNLVFRTAEIGVALWFPCVLWNSMSPEQLWILNPYRLIKTREVEITKSRGEEGTERENGEVSERISLKGPDDCWICYDPMREDAGPIIQPCFCKGDVRNVHHNCLLNWLMEKPGRKDCRVCGAEYRMTQGSKIISPSRFAAAQDWKLVVFLVTLGLSSVIAACVTVKLVRNTIYKAMAVGIALLVMYVCIKIFCHKMLEAYNRAKISSLRIENNLPTISDSVLPGPSTSSEIGRAHV